MSFAILNEIMPRLWPTEKDGENILALEVLTGPYKGVVFSFSRFSVLNTVGPDGMVPTKFETVVHAAPVHFRPNEAFDHYSSEVLLAWLQYISVNNFNTLLEAETNGVQ